MATGEANGEGFKVIPRGKPGGGFSQSVYGQSYIRKYVVYPIYFSGGFPGII